MCFVLLQFPPWKRASPTSGSSSAEPGVLSSLALIPLSSSASHRPELGFQWQHFYQSKIRFNFHNSQFFHLPGCKMLNSLLPAGILNQGLFQSGRHYDCYIHANWEFTSNAWTWTSSMPGIDFWCLHLWGVCAVGGWYWKQGVPLMLQFISLFIGEVLCPDSSPQSLQTLLGIFNYSVLWKNKMSAHVGTYRSENIPTVIWS